MDEAKWYVVHTYSGYENKVSANLERKVHSLGMENEIFRIVIPMENEVEVKDGKKRSVQRKVFPGYVLVEMIVNDRSWYAVRNTPGVTGFVGSGTKPTPLTEEEVQQLGIEKHEIVVSYSEGDSVRINDGPLTSFIGTVDQIDIEKNKVRVIVSMFGRETPVELELDQVELVND